MKPDRFRDPATGQYAYEDDWSRLCKCGHTLGVHVAGGFECMNSTFNKGGESCDCRKFRPTGKRQPTKFEDGSAEEY